MVVQLNGDSGVTGTLVFQMGTTDDNEYVYTSSIPAGAKKFYYQYIINFYDVNLIYSPQNFQAIRLKKGKA